MRVSIELQNFSWQAIFDSVRHEHTELYAVGNFWAAIQEAERQYAESKLEADPRDRGRDQATTIQNLIYFPSAEVKLSVSDHEFFEAMGIVENCPKRDLTLYIAQLRHVLTEL